LWWVGPEGWWMLWGKVEKVGREEEEMEWGWRDHG
jgi:hypothetical protein